MNNNETVEDPMDVLFENFNPARTPVAEPEKKIIIWPFVLILGAGLGYLGGIWFALSQSARTIDDLRLAERQAVEKMEAALDFTKLIKSDTIEAAQALYACRTGKPSAFVCEATKLQAEHLGLPIVFDPPFEDTKAAQDLAWKGVK